MILNDINAFVYPISRDKYIKLATVPQDGFAWSQYVSCSFLDEHFSMIESYVLDVGVEKIYDPRLFYEEGIFSVSCHKGGVANQLFFKFTLEDQTFKIGDFLFDAKSIQNDIECKNLIIKGNKIFYDFSRNFVLDFNFKTVQRTRSILPNLRGGSNVVEFSNFYYTLCHRFSINNGLRLYKGYLVKIDPDKFLIKEIKELSLNPDSICSIPIGQYLNNNHYLSLKEVVFPMSLWTKSNSLWSSMGINDSKTLIKKIL